MHIHRFTPQQMTILRRLVSSPACELTSPALNSSYCQSSPLLLLHLTRAECGANLLRNSTSKPESGERVSSAPNAALVGLSESVSWFIALAFRQVRQNLFGQGASTRFGN